MRKASIARANYYTRHYFVFVKIANSHKCIQ